VQVYLSHSQLMNPRSEYLIYHFPPDGQVPIVFPDIFWTRFTPKASGKRLMASGEI